MPYLQLRDSRYPLAVGENRISRNPDADIRLHDVPGKVGDAVGVISLGPDGTATVSRPQAEGSVLLNGVHIGAEPSPLLHGDRLSVDGCELHFADEAQLGETIRLPATADTTIAKPSASVHDSRSGGRLVSLVDGREYAVPSTGLSIGRDVACDVVLVAPTISRRHATLRATPLGYRLLDTSANGVFVNDAKVAIELPLGRGDTVRVGSEEFRFYASPEAAQGQVDLAAVPSLQRTAAIPTLKRPTPLGVPTAADSGAPRPVLAVLEISNEGPAKGTRHSISSPLAHVGRAAHNDVIIVDESVSELHAKLQRREETWYLMDLDSTNGTYAGGGRLNTEFRLTANCDVRFGGVKMIFRPMDAMQQASGSTRVIAGFKAPDPKRADPGTPRYSPLQEKQESAVVSRSLLLFVAAALGFAVYVLVRGGLR